MATSAANAMGTKDPQSRRMIGGMMAGAAVGTLVTLNPVGTVVGAMIGAGAGAGVHELSKDIKIGNRMDEHRII
jgi:hypothetical protein